jgi:phage terminase small subunit
MLPTASLPSGKKLTRKQQSYVDALVMNGGKREAAAISAGYSPKTARVQAHAMLKIPHVLQALIERTAIELVSSAPNAANTLTDLLKGKSEYVRLEAAKDLLDRAGLKPVEKHDHRVSGSLSVDIDLS